VQLFTAEVDRHALAPQPARAEVMDLRWMEVAALRADARRRPHLYAPWLRLYLDRAWPLLARAA